MSIDMLNIGGGSAPVRPSPPPSRTLCDAGPEQTAGGFADMMEAQAEAPVTPQLRASRGKAAKKEALPQAGDKEASTVPAAKAGGPKLDAAKEADKVAGSSHRKQKTSAADETDAPSGTETAAIVSVAAPVPPAPIAVTAPPAIRVAESDAPVGSAAPVGPAAPVGSAAKPFFISESVSETLPAEKVASISGKDGKPALAGDIIEPAPEQETVSAGRSRLPAPAARPGEATELLGMVKSELPGKAPDARPLPGQDEFVRPEPSSASRAVREAAAANAAPAASRAPSPPGLAVATDHAPDRAQPVLARVAGMLAAEQDGTPVASARERATVRVSSLAIAAAQSADAAKAATPAAAGDSKSEAPVPGRAGKAGDVRSTADTATPIAPGTASLTGVASITPATGITAPQGLLQQPGSLGATLGQQVVDLGVSGQWIDDIARQIASISANPGHGSFQIASQGLGTVRVDIIPGEGGTQVQMTVDNEAAQVALVKDQARLVQDAQLASVRIGDIRIDRVAPAADAQRGDMGQSGQNGGGTGQQSAQASAGQSGGQGGQPGQRQDAMTFASGNSGGNGPKSSFGRAVINDAVAAESVTSSSRNGRADTARYA